MSQTSHSPKLFFFFAIFIPSEIQALSEILFCHLGIVFLLLYRNYWAKSWNSRNKFLTQNWYKSEFPSLIFTEFCLHFLHNALNKKTYRKWQVIVLVFAPQMVKLCDFFGASFYENVRKELLHCYHICPCLYKILLSKGTPFYTHVLSHIMSEKVSKHQFQWIWKLQ